MLQLIMDDFKELKSEISTNTTQLKNDVWKSDMSKIRADLIIQVHVMENKIGNCIRVIREELETQIGALCTGQTVLEERFDKQQKNVISIVEQQTWNLRKISRPCHEN